MWVKSRSRVDNINNLFDAVGLGIFVTGGVNAAMTAGFGDHVFLTIFVGVLPGVGGGMLRDMMVGTIPRILRRRIYAVAAIAGASFYYVCLRGGLDAVIATLLTAVLVVALRLLATHYQWSLPRVPRN